MRVPRGGAALAAVAALVVGAAALAGAGVPVACPLSCECSGDDLLWYYCGNYIVKARDDGYLEINCQNTELNCSALPTVEIGRDAPLQRLELTQCSLPPAGEVSCGVRGARGAGELALQQAVGGVTADNLRGMEIETLFMRFMPDAITSFPISAIEAVPSLRRVRLVSGSGLPLPPRMFARAPPLRFLEVSMSGVSDLPAAAFLGLANLTALSLWGNNIRNVSVGAFDGLVSLQQLVLNSNPLGALPPGVFAPTPALRRLLLENVALTEISEGVFAGLLNLEEVKLRTNGNLKLGARAFSNLPSLASLTLTRCNVSSLPADLFHESNNLVNLTLSGDGIRHIPEELFANLSAVRTLDLSENSIGSVSRLMFAGMRALAEVDLSGNTIQELPDRLFAGLTGLKSVRVSRCQLHSVSYFTFVGASSIEHLSLSHNRLEWAAEDTELSSPFHMLNNLKELDLSHNSISYVYSDWRFVLRLRELNLTHNNFSYLAQSDVQYFGTTLENIPMVVDFRHNKIETIQPRAFWNAPSPLAKILLDDNPFNCDCHLYSFLQEVQQANQTKYAVSAALCSQPGSLERRPLLALDLQELTCPVPHYESESCGCLVRSALNRVECECASLAALPQLEGSGLNNMSVRLRSAPGRVSLPEYVRELNLSGLGLEAVPDVPPTLQLLDLTRNRIKTVPKQLLTGNTSLMLAQNPIACDCGTAEEVGLLQRHLRRSPAADYGRVTCAGGRALALLDAASLCNVYKSSVAGVLFAASLILVASLAAVLYRYRVEAQVFLYSRGWCLRLLPREAADADKQYDVFVSFAVEDEEFVLARLLPRLERGLRLHVQHRDWEAGGEIPAHIRRSVAASRRTLVLLSARFLRGVWAREVFRTVHAQASADKRARAVLVLLDVTRKQLDEDVVSLLSLSTFIKYNERMFWDKLMYALPRKDACDCDAVVAEAKPQNKTRAPDAWKGNGLNVVLNEDGKLINAGYVKE